MTDSHFIRDISVGVGGPAIGILGSAVFSDPNLKTASLAFGAIAALLACIAKTIDIYKKLKND